MKKSERRSLGFELCFDEKTGQLCTRDIKTGKITNIPDEELRKNVNNKLVNNEEL